MDGAGNDWCIEDEETYEFKDCDGDGIPDPTCTAETSFGVIQSSNACKHKWTNCGKKCVDKKCIEGNLLTYVQTLCFYSKTFSSMLFITC